MGVAPATIVAPAAVDETSALDTDPGIVRSSTAQARAQRRRACIVGECRKANQTAAKNAARRETAGCVTGCRTAGDRKAHGFVAAAFISQNLESAKAAAMDPPAPSLFWGAKAYHQLALEAFARLGGLPESVELHAVKAKILHGHNQDIEAANEWRAALRLAPGNRGLESELATSLFLAHDYKPAMALIEELLPRDGSSPDLNFMMGESLLRTEQPEKAVTYLETALRADSKMLPAHASLGLALAKLDRGGDGDSAGAGVERDFDA